jgi:hypothetical protein
VDTAWDRSHAGVIDRLNNPVSQSGLCLSSLGQGGKSEREEDWSGQKAAECAQRGFSSDGGPTTIGLPITVWNGALGVTAVVV